MDYLNLSRIRVPRQKRSNETMKYKTVQTKIRLANDMESIFIKKDIVREYCGYFAKIVKISKDEIYLMYFNNEQDLFKVTYQSAMIEDLGNGLQINAQDEIIEDEQFVDALTSPSN
ncbi:hypothetical protein C1646_761418 [Rhizophagus diaphanus]|nr:hypothetical protein C1646_761418 [Rhizophagus diaphanus] [Rhizophagus sp. MUCL 43196]